VPYDTIISRTDADALIPKDVADQVIAAATQESAALSLFRNVQLSSKLATMPVLSALPISYWVNGDTGLKQTSEAAWAGVTLTAEELATIIPIPEAVVDDSSFDVWAELRPALAEAIAQTLDAAAIGGISKPASWPAAVVPAAIAAGNAVELGTATVEEGGVTGDLDSAFDLVEADGYTVTGIAAVSAMRGLLRKARDAGGNKLADVGSGQINGVPIEYMIAGTVPATTRAVVGDFNLAVVGIRKDITYKLLDQAVITDAGGLVIFNLPQQDMVAMRVTARYAYATAVPATRTGGSGFPFSVLQAVTP
jgi:HK97 family phage major capsid protein